MGLDCRSLFPFEKIRHGARVLIYGCTTLAMDYLEQLNITQYATCCGFLDRRAECYAEMPVPVYPPERAGELKPDYVIIAMLTPAQWKTIEACLLSVGIEREKLVFGHLRRELPMIQVGENYSDKCEGNESYNKTGKLAIAVKFNGALGDNVIRKSVVEALVRIVPDCVIDIYSPVASSVLISLYYGCPYINSLIDDGGLLYQKRMRNYDLALRIETLPPNIDFISDVLVKKNPNLFEAMNAYKEYYHGDSADPNSSTFININRALFLGQNCYTALDGGVLGIKDMRVSIQMDPAFFERYLNLGLGSSYITFGCASGAGVSGQTAGYKQWPITRWEEFVLQLKSIYKGIKVVQLGAKGTKKLKSVDVCFAGEDLRLVQYILHGALCHVDIESGLVHLATQLGTRCVVLLGPTQRQFWCYPQNMIVAKGDCSSCYGLYRGDVRCARNCLQSQCMTAISVDDVLVSVSDCLKGSKDNVER